MFKQVNQTQLQPNPTAGGDPAILKRWMKTRGNRKFRIFCPILNSLFQQTRLLPNLLDIKLTFTKADEKFQYITTPANNAVDYAITIESAHFAVKRIKLYPSIEESLVARLSSGSPAKFYFRNGKKPYKEKEKVTYDTNLTFAQQFEIQKEREREKRKKSNWWSVLFRDCTRLGSSRQNNNNKSP